MNKKIKSKTNLFILTFFLLLVYFFSSNVYANFFITEIQPNPKNSSLEFLELYFNNTIFDNNTKIIIKDFYSEDILTLKDIYIIENNNNNKTDKNNSNNSINNNTNNNISNSNFSLYPLKNFVNSSFIILNSSMIISEYPLKILEGKNFNKSLVVFLNSKIGNGLSNKKDIIKINFSNSNKNFYRKFYYNNTVFNKSFNYNFKNKSYFLYYENPVKIFFNNNFTEKFNIRIKKYEYNNNTNNTNTTNNSYNLNNTNNTNDTFCFYNNISIILEKKIFENKIKFKIKNNTYYTYYKSITNNTVNNSIIRKYYYYYYFTDLDENNITKIKKSNTNYYKSFTPKSLEKDNILFLKIYYYNPCNKKEIIRIKRIVLYKNNDYEEKIIDENNIKYYKEKIKSLEEENNNLKEEIKIAKVIEEKLKENSKEKTLFIKSFYTRQKYYKENNSLFYTLKRRRSFENNTEYELFYCNLKFLKKISGKDFNNNYYKGKFYSKNVNNLYLFIIQNNYSNNTSSNKSKIYYYKKFNNKLLEKIEILKKIEKRSINNKNNNTEYKNIFVDKKTDEKKFYNNKNFSITSFVTKKIDGKKSFQKNKKISFDIYNFVLKYSFTTIFFLTLLYLLIKNRTKK